MKHFITVLSLILAITLVSCENANVIKLKKKVVIANAECPVNYGIGGDLLSIKYDEKENNVVMYFSVNNEIGGQIFLKSNKEGMQKQLRLMLQGASDQTFIKDLINAGAGLSCIYKNASTGKTLQYSIDADELKKIYENPLSPNEVKRMAIENRVAMENASCPYKSEEGVTVTNVALVDDNVVYNYQVDESVCDFNSIDAHTMKQAMIELWREMKNDPTIQREFQLATGAGLGYKMRYTGSKSKKCVEFGLTSDELYDIFSH